MTYSKCVLKFSNGPRWAAVKMYAYFIFILMTILSVFMLYKRSLLFTNEQITVKSLSAIVHIIFTHRESEIKSLIAQ